MRFALVLTCDPAAEATATALELAERLLARGHRVTVFAHQPAASLAAGETAAASAVAALVRRGVHGGTLDWVVDASGAARLGVERAPPEGVVAGDPADMWAFVRDADVVLATPGGGELQAC
jgi:hypothetical protein